MRNYFFLVLVLLWETVSAAAPKYPVAAIPAHLLQNAHVVKRSETVRMELVATGKVVVKKNYVLTVLDAEGASFAALEEPYDKLREVKSIEGWLYDASGNELRRLKAKEVEDRSAISGISLYEDSRVKRHSFAAPAFPYTVVYETEVVYNHSFYLEPWMPQDGEHVSVQESSLAVVFPAGYPLRYRHCNYKEAPVKEAEGGREVLRWKVEGLKAVVRPFAAPVWNELVTAVYLAPSRFYIEGFQGSMNTWKELGAFHATLNKGRDVLPPVIAQEVSRITAGLSGDREKAIALYRYLQQNTRYISIQLGIGGWQPFEASFVAQKGYGDCKALSNYMYALLKAAGIRSHYAIIRAGNSKEARSIMEDFPMKQSNHVILCVPLQGDSLWLECTDQNESPGYLGSFTGNRKALLVTEEGGALAATPRYGVTENTQLRTISGKLDGASGTLEAKVTTQYGAMQQDSKQMMLERTTKEELKKSLNAELDLVTYDIVSYRHEQTKGTLPRITEHLDLLVNRYATVSGKRLFILPNLLNRTGNPYQKEGDRTCDFVFDYPFRDVDSVAIELPDGYVPESLPAAVTLQTPFGFYSSSVKLEGTRLLYHRVWEQNAGRFKPQMAEQIAQFFAAMHKADHARVVLVRKE